MDNFCNNDNNNEDVNDSNDENNDEDDNDDEDIKNDKIIQVLAYAFLFEQQAKGQPIEVGIISFKNLKAGFLPFAFKVDKEVQTEVTPAIISAYLDELATLLAEIVNPDIPFVEKVN